MGEYYGEGGANMMVAFDASGGLKWVVQNDWPAIATADGGDSCEIDHRSCLIPITILG